jgi:hypothetical protein
MSSASTAEHHQLYAVCGDNSVNQVGRAALIMLPGVICISSPLLAVRFSDSSRYWNHIQDRISYPY